ncbi:MAG TPA: cytochrome P460 family protein [Pyrinomonadaceae bacterium]|nr:cytochrome P460 family protein [Pyrinomonadaceae bacterium]
MTRRKIPYLLIPVAGFALVIALVGRQSQGAKDEFRFDAVSLKDTSLWTKVNAEPYRISVAVDTLCRAPTADDYAPFRKSNPHAASFITVYVNNIGREAMFAKQVQQFPEGSVIVKEKISTYREGSKPLLYTLMRKREPGYNPEVGDWEFSVVAADGKQVEAVGKIESCQFCHKNKKDSDFIFRPYLKSN